MLLPNLPTQLPDETLYSLAARIRLLNGLRTDRDACAILFGDLYGQRVADIFADLAHFCAVTSNSYGSSQDVVNSATVLPFFLRLGSWPGLGRPVTHVGMAAASPDLPENHGLASISNGYPHLWRWCPACKSSDLREHGVSFWHRSHQLPGVGICTLHLKPLREVPVPFRQRQQNFMLPDNISSLLRTDHTVVSISVQEPYPRLAQLAESILRDTSPPLAPGSVQATIIDEIAERGLVTRGKIRKNEFAEEVSHYFAAISLWEPVVAFFGRANLVRLARELTESVQMRPALHNLLLIDWLFGSWALFRKRCTWRIVMDAEFKGAVPRQSEYLAMAELDQWEQLRASHRRICMAFLRRRSAATRTMLWKVHPRSCRWLTLHDAGWIEKMLPVTSWRAYQQLNLF